MMPPDRNSSSHGRDALGGHRGSLLHGIAAAFALSLCGGALLALLGPMFGASSALRCVVALLGLAYLLYLLACSTARTGRVVTVAVWLGAAALLWFADLSLGAYVAFHAGMIWLVRSLHHHSSILAALADLGLTVLAAAFSAWAVGRTGSFWLAMWCFFLVQAFFVLLPASFGVGGPPSRSRDDDDGFDRAHRAAEAALRRLAETR